MGEEGHLHYFPSHYTNYYHGASSTAKIKSWKSMFVDFFVHVILVSVQVQGCVAVLQTPKVASLGKVLACTRRQLAQYIVVVVRQTYDLCVCWHPMPAEPAEPKAEADTEEEF